MSFECLDWLLDKREGIMLFVEDQRCNQYIDSTFIGHVYDEEWWLDVQEAHWNLVPIKIALSISQSYVYCSKHKQIIH